jgi:glycosyltransferase involved in cell wall biosynthesis
MLKVLYISSALYSDNGSVVHAKEFLSALKVFFKSRVEVEILPEIDFRASKFIKILSLFPFLARLIKRRFDNKIINSKYDLIIIRNFHDITLPSRLKAKDKKIKIFIELNDLVMFDRIKKIPLLSRYVSMNEVKSIDCADRIFPISEELKKQLLDLGIERKKMIVNHNGVSIDKFDKSRFNKKALMMEYQIPPGSLVLCYTGSITKNKKLDLIIESIERVSKSIDKKIYFLIASDGKINDEIDFLLEEILNGKVSYKRNFWVSHDRVPELLAVSDIAIFPFASHHMSPLKLFEYLAMEIPTIGPKTAAVEEVFEDEKHLLLVSSQIEFENALIKISKNYDHFLNVVALQGSKHVKENYSWKDNAEKVISEYDRVKDCDINIE